MTKPATSAMQLRKALNSIRPNDSREGKAFYKRVQEIQKRETQIVENDALLKQLKKELEELGDRYRELQDHLQDEKSRIHRKLTLQGVTPEVVEDIVNLEKEIIG